MLDLRVHRHALLAAGSEQIDGEQLARRVEDLAKEYRRLPAGLAVLQGHSTLQFVSAFLALLNIGRPVAVTSASWTETENDKALALLGEFIRVDSEGHAGDLEKRGFCDLHPETSVVLFTSGSTGQARAVQLSRRNIEANLQAVISSLDFSQASEQVLFLPLSYSFGLLGQLLPALHLGVKTTLLDGFGAAPRWIAEHGMHGMWSGVPPHWIALLRWLSAQSGLKIAPSHVISAGGRLDLEVRRQLRAAFPEARLYNNYGLTEASPRLLSLRSDSPLFFSEAVGFPVGDWQVRCTPDGELLARGSQVMLGYMHGAESGRVRDGWLHTGDLGRIDNAGCVFLQGRADHLVKVAGERISLAEIESALSAISGVQAACVLARPHPINGSVLDAFLECRAGLPRAGLLTELKKILSTHKIPQGFFRLEALPLNTNGKVDRRRVEDLRASAQALE